MNKNNSIRKHLAYFFYFAFFFLLFAVKVNAQCNNVSMTLTRTNATCVSNGKILVTLSGSDVGNIRQSDMEFKVDGTVSRSWANYVGNTITNLPAGTYTISMRAFCNSISDWMVFNNSVTTTLTSSYTEMDAYLGVPRKTLNCTPTGMVPIIVNPNTGSAPFTITITNYPASYTGSTSFTLTRLYNAYSVTQEIEGLPAGNYTFTIADACSYTQTLNATVGKMDQDYDLNLFYPYVYPPHDSHSNCNVVGIYRYYISRPTDETHYFQSYTYKYYDVGFQINGAGPIEWVHSDSLKLSLFNFTLPYTIKTFRANYQTYKITPYLRVKGTSCTFQLNDIRIQENINTYIGYSDLKCDKATIRFYPYSNNALCYPYKWRIVKDATVIYNWSSEVYSSMTQTATNVPYGSRIEFLDHDGYTWYSDLYTSPPSVSYGSIYTPCEYNGRTADTIHSYFYIYFYNVDKIPIGTKFEFVSGPMTPLHTSVTTTEEITQFYPFSTDYKSWEYKNLQPGLYTFKATLPGAGCTEQTLSVYHAVSYVKTPFTYTTKETCGGLNIIPTGGQLAYKFWDGSLFDITPYYYVYTMDPYVQMERGPVGLGDTLFFPTSAQYIFGVTYHYTGSCLGDADTINYVKTPFQLNPNVTAAYVCEGAGLGFIRVAGMGGSGNYSYELYDQGVKSATSSTGVFSYGTAGSTYTIRLIDTDPACAASYDQDVQMLDLTSAHILYTSSPANTYCLDEDSIYLKCISLGQTTYTWTGPGITATNKNRQNLGIAISDLGVGTYTYSITVKPEGCGNTMNQSITVKVEDCSGARDDYKTLFVNTKDTVDVLANDGFPSTCVGSVIPIITVSPTKGTATIVNKKVVYTPNTNFVGRDSLTYSTNCGGTITTAKVYLTVIDYPDNITDADCYVTPPETLFSFTELTRGSNSDVHALTTPVCGDIDNDGKIEIIVPQYTGTSSTSNLFIYEMDPETNQLVLQQTLITPKFFAEGGSPYSIAKVDGSNYATIFLATDNSNTSASDKMQLIKYIYNGTSYSEAARVTYSTTSRCQAPAPVITDFNGDGIAEIAVYDKVYNAKTLTLLADGGYQSDLTKGFGEGAHPNDLDGSVSSGSFMVAADVDGDGLPEFIGGNCVYKVVITNPNGLSGNSFTLWRQCSRTDISGNPHEEAYDGATAVADFDNDGLLDIVVTTRADKNKSNPGYGALYVWNPRTGNVMNKNLVNNFLPHMTTSNKASGPSIPFIGDIDDDGEPEICLSARNMMYAYDYDTSTGTLILKWSKGTTDSSAATTMVLFDFNQDGTSELVYRDLSHLRIINGIDGSDLITPIPCSSATGSECPIVADVNGDGSAEILVTGGLSGSNAWAGYLRIFSSNPAGAWAPARKVWNQFMYNAVNVNEDLTIPKYQLNPATVFPGADGVLGTADDIRPYNAFLQQQTILDKNGSPVWLTPDVYSNSSLVTTSVSGKSLTINVGIVNKGDAAMRPPVYVTLYKNTISAANKILTGNANIHITPGDTGFVSITIADITLINPVSIIIRVNDDGTKFPYQPECDDTNNVVAILNPSINLMMKKDATLEGIPHNGTYDNPVAALYNETIEYTITAVNANTGIGKVIIRDTLPPYLDFVSSNPVIVPTPAGTSPQRSALEWTIAGVASMATTSVTVKATPQAGSSASQPMFINRAWVTVSDTITVPTNSTYHQGASVGIATFSAGFGGNIYNAAQQALDYKTTPRTGIVIVPDEGYRFAGWSHDEYVSLRGKTIRAEEGIMHYDTLTVYGDIKLQANFELEKYPIEYHLNGAVNAEDNPPVYTIESGSIILRAPEKAGDAFTGWTGSNGERPQLDVNIPKGSTGELEFYANFLRSGREDDAQLNNPEEDKIWAAKDELYIRTSKPGSVVRIYSTEGVLQKQQVILQAGEIKMKLLRGIYVVTLNNNIGQKIMIE